jgi:hypothetical protein
MALTSDPRYRFRLVAITPAAELPRVDLAAALSVCAAIRHSDPERFERAALRWLARFCVERPGATLDDVRAAAWAFERMGSDPNGALETLAQSAACQGGPGVNWAGRRSIADTGSVHSDRKVLRC